jgi:hypothetical protein
MLLRLQQFQVDLTDTFQGVLEFVVITQPLLHGRLLFGAKAELSGAAARTTNGQNPDWVALAGRTDGATSAMADEAVEQRAADDLGGEWEGSSEFSTPAKDRFLIHLY